MKRIALVFVLVSSFTGSRGAVAASAGADTHPLTVIAAGDIACDPTSSHFNGGQGDDKYCQEQATSDLAMSAHPDAVLALGDNQYENAALDAFMHSYDLTWARLKALTHPVLGNHEYQTPNAAGYFAYFGALAGPAPGGYYSFDLGSWHLIALNSECSFIGGCGPGSTEEQWLRADLASHRSACTLAYWHEPRFTSGNNGNHPQLQAFWDDLYTHGADLVLSGHDHIYERFAPQNPVQILDPGHGIRQITVGTGGNNHQPKYGTLQPLSEVRDNTTYGVLRLSLHEHAYDWQFLPAQHAGNGQFTDSGNGTCHGPGLVPLSAVLATGPTSSPFHRTMLEE